MDRPETVTAAVLGVLLAIAGLALLVVALQRRRFAAQFAKLTADVALTEDVTGLGYWSRAVDSQTSWWSPGMYRLLKRDPATFRPTLPAVTDMIHPDDRHQLRILIDPAATDGKGGDAEVRMFCGDGSIKDILVVTRYRFGRAGKVAELFGINIDITARKAASRIVALREQQLQRAVAVMGAAVWDLDFATNILTAGERWAEMLGHDPAQFRLTLEMHNALVHPEDLTRVVESQKPQPATVQIDIEYRMRHQGGAYIWIRSRAQVQEDGRGQPARMIGAAVEVTERRAAADRIEKRAREATLLHEGVRLTAEATSFAGALQAVIDMICATIGWGTGHAFLVESAGAPALRSADIWHDAEVARYEQLRAINAGMTFAPGVGLPGDVWMAGRPIWVADIRQDPQFTHLLPIQGLHAAVAFPIVVKGETRAVVEFFSDRVQSEDSDLMRVFESLGRQIGGVIERQEAAESLVRQAREQYLLHAGMTLAAESHTFEEVVQRILDLICETIGWPVGHAYMLPHPDAEELEPTGIWHFDDAERYAVFKDITLHTRLRKGMGLPGRVWESSRPAWIEDVAKDHNFVRGTRASLNLHGAVCLPVRVGGEFRAVLEFFSEKVVPKDMDLLRVFETLGLQIGGAIERQKAYDDLAASRESLELAIQASQAGHFDIDLGSGRAYWSPRLREMLGIKNPTFIPTAATIATYIHPADQQEFLADLEEFRTNNTPLDLDARVNMTSGRQVWAHIRAMRQLDKAGQPMRTVGFIRDISRQKLAERALAESERKFRSLVEGSIQGLVIHRRFKPLFCNRAFATQLGYDRVEDVLALDSMAIHVAPEANYDANDMWRRALTHEFDGKKREIAIIDNRAERKWFESVGQIIDWEGEPAWQLVVMDVTERIERETELRAARDRLKDQADELAGLAQNLEFERSRAEDASAAKSQFLAMMSHELRTPMTGVLGMADLLMIAGLNEEQKELTRLLTRSARALLDLLNDILDFSKIEAGQLEIESIPFRLSDLMSDVKGLFAPVATEKGLGLTTRLPPTYWNTVVGDPRRLRQVLANLVSNAIKFTAKGEIDLALTQSRPQGGGILLQFSVRDTGIGIAAADIERLFQPFVQADISTSRTYGGSGLGLAICRRLVTAMGGEITLKSTPGVGSTFTFDVRVGHSQLGDAAPLPVPETVAKPPAGAGRRILVAEDSDTSRKLLTMMLARLGHSVEAVANGAEAVAAARAGTYDIVLMDMQMPVLDGPDATREIRALGGAWARVPVIALTADVIPGNRAGYFASGIDAIVGKPIDWAELDAEISRLIAARSDNTLAVTESESVPTPEPALESKAEPIILDDVMIDGLIAALGAEIFTPMLVTFRTNMNQYRGDLEAAVAAGDLKKAKRTAHALKGLCAQFGAPRASDLAKFIEVDSKSLDEIQPMLPDVAEAVAATERALAGRFPQISL